MNSKFKVGDRVAFYFHDRRVGVVVSICGDRLDIQEGKGVFKGLFSKACRRLVKKERRRVWISQKNLEKARAYIGKPNGGSCVWCLTDPDYLKCEGGDALLEFVEVRKKKI